MRATEKYLEKIPQAIIKSAPRSDLSVIVTIPAFNEPELIKSLESLLSCYPINGSIEVLVNINSSELESAAVKEFNTAIYKLVKQFAKTNSSERFQIHILFSPNQDAKKAGAGLARKQLMDEAFRRLILVGNEGAIITGFDADSTCDKNYFVELKKLFESNSKMSACSIRFEHDIFGSKYLPEIYDAVALYELYLRYFINAQKLIGTRYAFQTVGSSFAVRAKHYAMVNGMSLKKAGEDFYFLQKLIALGEFSQLNTTCVYPSSRISNRVGFGTGPAVADIVKEGEKKVYNLKSFVEIKKLFDAIDVIYRGISILELDLHPQIIIYLNKLDAEKVIINLRKNNKTLLSFRNAFMQWFGGLHILKLLNILRAFDGFADQDLISQVNALNLILRSANPKELLIMFREYDLKQ